MCSQRMDNYQGDLTDIIRATGGNIIGDGGGGNKAVAATSSSPLPEWQFPSNPMSYSTDPAEDFGDPFTHWRDPLLHDIDNPVPGLIFHSSNNENNNIIKATSVEEINLNPDDHQEMMKISRPAPNIFSRMLQISPGAKLPVVPLCDSPAGVAATASPRGLKGGPMILPNDHGLISPNSSKGCLVESPAGLQISCPRNTGIKRRKSQTKKVVCIPAPAPANSRPSGEVVPSDLWAWRKYGQKPIKGSPYPRGYYRCSSSKGCSARKQVERSRTDPNMLVITYTSEHNHPWPTQRNALAGSTRSQPSKNSAAAKNSPKPTNPKEEHQLETTTDQNTAPPPSSATVKEENMDRDFDHNHLDQTDNHHNQEFDHEVFPNSYKPALPDSNNQSEDSFFADLGEIEADSLDMLFTQGFSGGDDGRDDKSLDPFSLYDWAAAGKSSITSASAVSSSNGGATTTSYGEASKSRDS